MINLSKQLLALSEKIKILIASHADIVKENQLLKNKIYLLESDIEALRRSLEEKKEMLDDKDEDSIFATMLIDDLLQEFSSFNFLNNGVLVKLDENKEYSFNGLEKNNNEEI